MVLPLGKLQEKLSGNIACLEKMEETHNGKSFIYFSLTNLQSNSKEQMVQCNFKLLAKVPAKLHDLL